jgi:hypothetical protein
MKFRCTGNSIRLRVRKSDLEALQMRGAIREEIIFAPGQTLAFVLELGQGEGLQAAFSGGVVRVVVPEPMATAWIASSEVGLEAVQETDGQAGSLHIQVEKDFPCRHTSEANREDTFYELAPDDPTVC